MLDAVASEIADLLLTRGLNLLRLSAGIRSKVLSLLTQMSKELTSRINSEDLSDFGKQRLNTLLRESNIIIDTYYTKAQKELLLNLDGVAELEAKGLAKIISKALDARVEAALPTQTYLEKLVGNTLVKGAASSSWWEQQQAKTTFKFASAVRMGAAQGETNAEIVARVAGTKATPGVIDVAKKDAYALVQTSVQAVANAARLATFKKNADIIECLVWLATLDSHTCLICAERDLLEYSLEDQSPIGHDLPWDGGPGAIHFSCRCVITTKTKSFKDLGLDIPEPEPSTRPSSTGEVPANMKFSEWLAKKDAVFRKEYLGEGRAELYESGKITLNDLMDQRGNPLTLDELRSKHT